MKDKIVITIARQYGSGGRTIGNMLAEKLGIHFYDKELMKLASDESGINEALFANADEKLRRTSLFKIAHNAYNGELISPESDDFVSTKNLFNYQAKIIKGLAEEESCVIVGRCADYILKERENVVNLFVHASLDFRIKRAIEVEGISKNKAAETVMKKDKSRANYYKYHSGERWDNVLNYDMAIRSDLGSMEDTVACVKAYLDTMK